MNRGYNMKNIIKIILSLLMVFTLGACHTTKEAEQPKPKKKENLNLNLNINDIKIPMLKDTREDKYKENTFTTLNGDKVTYNMNTRKIVCLFGSQDVVAFGIHPLAYEGETNPTGYEDFYEDSSPLMNTTPFSSEEVMSYQPELILVNQRMTKTNIKALEKIAPVIPLYTDSTDFNERLTYIGKIFGLEDHAQKLIEYADNLKESMLKEMRKLKLENKTLTLYTYMGAISIPPERGWFMNTILYDYLHIKRLDNVKKFMRDESRLAYDAISNEKLKDYEGDLVIFANFGTPQLSTYVTDNVGWKALKAVKEKRVAVIDIRPYAQKGVILLYNQYMKLYEALKKAAQIH